MKICVDTNVLISATFWEGTSYKIMKLVEIGKAELFLSNPILKEYIGVLKYEEIQSKITSKNLEMKLTIDKLISLASIVVPNRKINVIKDDIDDNKILECAIDGRVDYIITKDFHLLKLKKFEGIEIITPEELLDILK